MLQHFSLSSLLLLSLLLSWCWSLNVCVPWGVLSGHARLYCFALHCVSHTAEGSRKHRSMPMIPDPFNNRQTWIKSAKFSIACCLIQDLMYPSLAKERARHKKKRLVQSPNSYFMDVKCVGKEDCSSAPHSVLCHVLKFMRFQRKQLSRLLQDHHNLQPCPDSCTLHWLLLSPVPASRRKVQTNWRYGWMELTDFSILWIGYNDEMRCLECLCDFVGNAETSDIHVFLTGCAFRRKYTWADVSRSNRPWFLDLSFTPWVYCKISTS